MKQILLDVEIWGHKGFSKVLENKKVSNIRRKNTIKVEI